jgi:hypothetical protein
MPSKNQSNNKEELHSIPKHKSVNSIWGRISRLLLYNTIMPLAPLLYIVWRASITSPGSSLYEVAEKTLSHGELVIICIPMLALSIHNVLMNDEKRTVYTMWIIGAGIILFFIATAIFADISSEKLIFPSKINEDGGGIENIDVLALSFKILAITFLYGIASIFYLSHGER